MRYLFIIILLTFFASCAKEASIPDPSLKRVRLNQIYCLRDFLIGEDPGGTWSIVTIPEGSTLSPSNLTGDNPCLNFNNFGCGSYTLQYKVFSTTCAGCADSTQINLLLRCCEVVGEAFCSANQNQ